MAPSSRLSTKDRRPEQSSTRDGSPPRPFKKAPESLQGFCSLLSPKHVYITHIDAKPRAFKRKIFLVPVLMNLAVVALFIWRLNYIGPYYAKLVSSALGFANDTTTIAAESTWRQLASVISGRAFTFLLDFSLTVFVWPWPVEFCLGRAHGNPAAWRWRVGFRDKEIYVRRSRAWDRTIGDVLTNDEGRGILMSYVRLATSPTLLQDKTGYLTMNGEWDLDWAAMVHATKLVDDKAVAMEAFRTLVLVHNQAYGWMCLDLQMGENAQEEERRRQVFAFRDALAAVGKEDLFFRWIEIIQFESSQPGGFAPEKQVEVAQKIRDLFAAEGIDFDGFWKESVGTDTVAGI